MPRFIIRKTVSISYEISVEAKDQYRAINKVWANNYDEADILSEAAEDVQDVEFVEEVDTSD